MACGQQDCAGLHGRFAEDDAGHERVSGVVTLKKKLVLVKCLPADDDVGAALYDLVNQQHGAAVWNGGLDFGTAHGATPSGAGCTALAAFSKRASTSLATMAP